MIISNAKLSFSLVSHLEPKGPAAEAFRILRTNLQFLSLDRPLRTLMVTSATPGEGKSFNAANLAIAYAQAGTKTCLVDTDLRRPSIARLFGRQNFTGVTTALVRGMAVEEVAQESEVPGLHVITSGPIPPNPAELLASQKMRAFMDAVKDSYEMVIYDAPPVMAVADPSVIGTRVDGVLLIVRSGVAGREEARKAKEALESVKATVLGVVLDGFERKHGSGYYYYYSSPKSTGK